MITTWIKSQDGTELPVLFSNAVSAQLAEEFEVPANEIVKFYSGWGSWPVGRQWRFFYLAVREGARVERVRFEMTYEEFRTWLFSDDSVMSQIVTAMIKSNPEPEKKTVKKVAGRR